MPTLMITAVYEGSPMGALIPGKPIPDLAVDVGGPGRDVVSGRTDASGSLTIDVPDTGSWAVHVTGEVEGGSLLGIRSVEIVGPLALSAVPVRFRPA